MLLLENKDLLQNFKGQKNYKISDIGLVPDEWRRNLVFGSRRTAALEGCTQEQYTRRNLQQQQIEKTNNLSSYAKRVVES